MATWKLASVAWGRGDLPVAESGLQDAIHGLQKSSATDARILGSEARLTLAQLRRDQGKPADAERECREVLTALTSQKEMEDQEKLALVCLARTLLDQGKVPEARRTLNRATAIPHRWPSALEDMDADLCEAEVLRAEGKAGQAEEAAAKVLAKAKACGDLPQQFDAQLLLGKIELETGRARLGRNRLSALEREATSKGWLLVASHARSAGWER
jgi:ATP/maltotriose-dependent transcriptional regulator MalT